MGQTFDTLREIEGKGYPVQTHPLLSSGEMMLAKSRRNRTAYICRRWKLEIADRIRSQQIPHHA
jgi:hypothetical protein